LSTNFSDVTIIFDSTVTLIFKTSEQVGLLKKIKQQIDKERLLLLLYCESIFKLFITLNFSKFCHLTNPQIPIFHPLGVSGPHFENLCRRISVFTTPVTSFYIYNQDPLLTDIRLLQRTLGLPASFTKFLAKFTRKHYIY